jgi:hypothetical protein
MRGLRPLRAGACLSLSGEYARFGRQAARALEIWRSMDGAADLVLEDDGSSPRTLGDVLPRVAARCDVLLGPYSTRLARAAGRIAADAGLLLWNHGGAGDDVALAHPGHVVCVLTPASRYSEPFLRLLAGDQPRPVLWITRGGGRFACRVADGAQQMARRLGIGAICPGEPGALPGGPGAPDAPDGPGAPDGPAAGWDLLTAGSFGEDIETVRRARHLPHPPRRVCAVAAGVREFAAAAGNARGVFGIAQWFPGSGHGAELGPDEADFLRAYAAEAGAVPDYPAVQAVAAAVLAAHCARLAGGTARDLLWAAAAGLDTSTLFGAFRIDPATGVQAAHETVLVRWAPEGLSAA